MASPVNALQLKASDSCKIQVLMLCFLLDILSMSLTLACVLTQIKHQFAGNQAGPILGFQFV